MPLVFENPDKKFGMCEIYTLLYAWQPVDFVFRKNVVGFFFQAFDERW
jgi:hypothetical protein